MISVGVGIITIHIEGMATAKPATRDCTEDNGTTLGKFLLHQSGPLSIGVQRGSAAVGAGLLHHAHSFLVITEELESISNQAHTIGIDTTTAS